MARDPGLRRMLDELVPIETRHAAFWQEFFGTKVDRLDGSLEVRDRLRV